MSIGKFRSNLTKIKAGVPQGSILSPLLFNLYFNDLSNVVNIKLYQYADDTVLVSYARSYTDAIFSLQMATTKVMDWFRNNVVDINGILKNVAYDVSPKSDVLKTLSLPDFNSLLLETVVLNHF